MKMFSSLDFIWKWLVLEKAKAGDNKAKNVLKIYYTYTSILSSLFVFNLNCINFLFSETHSSSFGVKFISKLVLKYLSTHNFYFYKFHSLSLPINIPFNNSFFFNYRLLFKSLFYGMFTREPHNHKLLYNKRIFSSKQYQQSNDHHHHIIRTAGTHSCITLTISTMIIIIICLCMYKYYTWHGINMIM